MQHSLPRSRFGLVSTIDNFAGLRVSTTAVKMHACDSRWIHQPIDQTTVQGMSAERLAQQLAEAGIVEARAVQGVVGDAVAKMSHAEFVAALFEAGLLTEFQRDQILADKTDSLLIAGGDFVLRKPLGKGGFGQVWLAWQPRLRREVALKSLRVAGNDDETVAARLLQEGQVLANLSHPNLIQVYDARLIDDVIYLVMQFIDGVDAKRFVETRPPLKLSQAGKILAHAAAGLEHAHKNGIVHRDVKPANLMIGRDSITRVLDLGLARISEDSALPKEDLTSQGIFAGSPPYMAPEQFERFMEADERSDIYSLGCTFFYLLTGREPYSGSVWEMRDAHAKSPIPSITALRPDINGVDDLLIRMMAKQPGERYQTASELLSDLGRVIKPSKTVKLPPQVPGAPPPISDSTVQTGSGPRRENPANATSTTIAATAQKSSGWKKFLVLTFAWIIAGAGTWFTVQYLLDQNKADDPGEKIAKKTTPEKTTEPSPDGGNGGVDKTDPVKTVQKTDDPKSNGSGKTAVVVVSTKTQANNQRPKKTDPVVTPPPKKTLVVKVPPKTKKKQKPVTKKKPAAVTWRQAGLVFRGTAEARGQVSKEVILEVVRAPENGKGTVVRVRDANNPLYMAVYEGDVSEQGGSLKDVTTLRINSAPQIIQTFLQSYRGNLKLVADGADLVASRYGVRCRFKRDTKNGFPSETALKKLINNLAGSQWAGLATQTGSPSRRVVVEITGVKYEGKQILARAYSVDDPLCLTTLEGTWNPVTATIKLTPKSSAYRSYDKSLAFISPVQRFNMYLTFLSPDEFAGYHTYATASLTRKSIVWKDGKITADKPGRGGFETLDPTTFRKSKWVATGLEEGKSPVPLRLEIADVRLKGQQVIFAVRSPTGLEVFEGTWNAGLQAFQFEQAPKRQGNRIFSSRASLILLPLGNQLYGRKGEFRIHAKKAVFAPKKSGKKK